MNQRGHHPDQSNVQALSVRWSRARVTHEGHDTHGEGHLRHTRGWHGSREHAAALAERDRGRQATALCLATSEPASFALSPMQSGMLFESLLGGARAGCDIEQLHAVLDEAIDVAALASAFSFVARRHDALSAYFEWEGVARPRQRVQSRVVVPVEKNDWRALRAEERRRHLTEFLERDRARGIDLTSAPLMRVTVFPVAERKTEIVWTFHHILIDGGSIPVVLAEVFAAYDAIRRGAQPSLPAPEKPFRDYVEWLAMLDSGRSRRFFRDLLAGKTSPTPLPLAEPQSRSLQHEGHGEARRRVDDAVLRAARDLARRTGTTLGTVVYAAWSLVLARTTGDDDVVFGATRACRRTALLGAAQRMVGLFINSPPIRARVDDARTVGEFLASIRAQVVALRDHEHTPLVDIQAVSELPRGAPLFESLLLFEAHELNTALRETGAARWSRGRVTLHEQPAPPLTLVAVETDHLELRAMFDRRRYRDAVVERILGYFAKAIAELAAGEHRTLAVLDVLPVEERRRVLVEWNDTARAFPEDTLIHEPFEAQVRAQPSAVAVECDGASLTYAELDARANRLAHVIRARGARAGTYVGVCLPRGIDLVVALLAIEKSGAAYVPLDPRYPQARLAFMMEDSKALFVVTDEPRRALFTGDALVIDGADAGAIARSPDVAPARSASSNDECYAIFTSGSTGTPKGVVLTHRAVINTFDWVTRTLSVGPGDRLLFVTSPCFDLSVYDTFGALGAGATVVVATDALLEDPEALAAAIVERRITIWDSAPAALQRLLTLFPTASTGTSLRLVMLSGDWIPLGLPHAVRCAFPSARVVSLGGATEAAIWSNWFPLGTLDPRWTSIPYGRPIQNARYHVLDARLRPVPIGVAGDLYIGGACLARGYLDRPELTSERFVRDPFAADPGERLYKTGDLARYFEDGELEFLGRVDFQVKTRGFRVELGEVEAALLDVDGVHECVCAAQPDASGQKSLVAYLVARPGARLDADTVRAAVGSKLASFMVPSRFVFLDAMPLCSNGKVDRKALPDPRVSPRANTHVAPRNDTERAVVAIWKDLLGCETIGVTDDFFDLGGHSLLAVMLASRIHRELGVKVPLWRVLQSPTIEALVASMGDALVKPKGGRHVITLSRQGTRPPMFLVSGAGGYGFVFRGMSQLMAGRHAVHVLNAVGADDEQASFDHSIEEMAAIYLSEVEATAPDGPVIIGGYSFGTLVAFELAHQLRLRGRTVPLLLSFDGFAPGFPELLSLPDRILLHARALFSASADARSAYARARWQNVRRRVLDLFGRYDGDPGARIVDDDETDRRLHRLDAALWRARGQYAPTHSSPSDLLLVKTAMSERWPGARMDDPLYGWRGFTRGSIDLVTVHGSHQTLFDEGNQRMMAAAILDATVPYEMRL